MKKVIFLDRDGTIIVDKIYLNDPNAIEYLPGVFEGMKSLRDHGYEFIVVTNQSGVPRGLVSLENLHEIHRRIRAEMSQHGVNILQFYFAPFMTDSNHPMRKPNPGMLELGIKDFNVDRKQSWMAGDRMTDVEAGHRAKMKTIFVTGTEDHRITPFSPPEFVAENFMELSQHIVSNTTNL